MTMTGPTPTRRRLRRRWRLPVASTIVAVLALAGLCVLMYPNVASWFAQLDQSRIISDAARIVHGDDAENAEQLRLAHAYNELLNSGAVVQANERLPSSSGTTASGAPAYAEVLNDGTTGVMARVRIPKIDVDLPVYHGTSDDTLLRGLGHLEGTSLPVGDVDGHAVITGHRGLAEATMFTNLDQLSVGDMFSISTFGQVLSYQVIETQVVDPDQTESLRPVAGQDLVTLVTCTPLGINSQRILVTGQRVHPTPPEDIAAAAKQPDIPGFPWWAVGLGAGVVTVVVYVWRAGYPPRRPRAPARSPVSSEADPVAESMQ